MYVAKRPMITPQGARQTRQILVVHSPNLAFLFANSHVADSSNMRKKVFCSNKTKSEMFLYYEWQKN